MVASGDQRSLRRARGTVFLPLKGSWRRASLFCQDRRKRVSEIGLGIEREMELWNRGDGLRALRGKGCEVREMRIESRFECEGRGSVPSSSSSRNIPPGSSACGCRRISSGHARA